MNETANLIITFQAGVDENNEPITVAQTFRNINPDASSSALHATAQAISTLVGHNILKVERVLREQL